MVVYSQANICLQVEYYEVKRATSVKIIKANGNSDELTNAHIDETWVELY